MTPTGTAPHVIAVTAYKGGVGKTHIASCLAAMLGTRYPTAVLDLDEQGDVALKLGAPVPDDAGDVLDWLDGPPGAALVRVPTAPYAFLVDPSPRLIQPDTVGVLTAERIRRAARRDGLRYVLLDTPYLGSDIARQAVAIADLVLLVATDELSLAHLDIGLAVARAAGTPARVLLNRQHDDTRTDSQVCARYAREHRDLVCPIRVRDDGWAAYAFRRGTSPLVVHRQARSPADFRALAEWLSEHLAGTGGQR